MIEYSYKVRIAELEKDILRLKMDLIKRPDNTRATEALLQLNKEKEWFENKVKSGEDPGVRIL